MDVRRARKAAGVVPAFKRVDTCAAEFEAATPYMYSSYDGSDECEATSERKVGPARRGTARHGTAQHVTARHSTAQHSTWAARSRRGGEAAIVSNAECGGAPGRGTPCSTSQYRNQDGGPGGQEGGGSAVAWLA